jgi:inorganic pyrophosphatase
LPVPWFCARLIGVIKISQKAGRKISPNDGLIAVDPLLAVWSKTKKLADLPEMRVAEIKDFFCHYRMPGGIEVSVMGRGDAHLLLRKAIKRAGKTGRRLIT